MQRVKNIDYDEDDIYSEEDEYHEEEQTHTAEDRENFNSLTPVVQAELTEAGLQASDREIQDALWHYYWDVGKSVAYLKNTRTPRTPQQQQGKKEKEKPKSKFDQAAEESAKKAGESCSFFPLSSVFSERRASYASVDEAICRRGGSLAFCG
jgi:elongation factor 1 alpha-like protein